ncbi:hypothetical protein scyTo_0020331, partial [Scyliorhinus torazame]|nr:hypothetical protein [Scyliorhinus torazame]
EPASNCESTNPSHSTSCHCTTGEEDNRLIEMSLLSSKRISSSEGSQIQAPAPGEDDQTTGTGTSEHSQIQAPAPGEDDQTTETGTSEQSQIQTPAPGEGDQTTGTGTSERSQIQAPAPGEDDQTTGTGTCERSQIQAPAPGEDDQTIETDTSEQSSTQDHSKREDDQTIVTGTDLISTISEFLTKCDDFQLFRLTKFYRDRLEQAIEEGVDRVSSLLTDEWVFSGQEHQKITELVEKGNRAGSSKLLLNLVMEKGSLVRRVMWESFVKVRHGVPKLDKILKELQEFGMNMKQDASKISNHLKGK